MKRIFSLMVVVVAAVGILLSSPLARDLTGKGNFSYALDTREFESYLENSFSFGESLDFSKIKIIKTDKETNQKEEIRVTPAMVEGNSLDSPGEKSIRIKYDGQVLKYTFTVKYTVNFIANGVLIDSQKVLSKDELQFPDGSIYVKSGSFFVGWTPALAEELTANTTFVARYVQDIVAEPTAVYGQKLSDVSLPQNEYGKWVFTDSPDTVVGNVGKNQFNVKFVSNLYGAAEVNSTVIIAVSKAKLEFEDVVLNFVYDGNIKYPTYTVPGGVRVEERGERAAEAGAYTFLIEIKSDCYEGMISGTYVISKAEATVKVPDYVFDFDTAKTFIPTEYTVEGEGGELLGSVTLKKPTVTGAGSFNIGVEISNAANVQLTVIGGNVRVEKSDLDILDPTLAEGVSAVYGDRLADITLCEHGSGTWSWKNPETLINVPGRFTATAVFVPNNPEGYNTVERTVTFAVYKKELEISVNKTDFVYNGSNIALDYIIADGSYTGVNVKVTYNGEDYAKNAGRYAVAIEIVDERYAGILNLYINVAKAVPVTDFGGVYEISWSNLGRTLGNVALPAGYVWTDTTTPIPDSSIGEAIAYRVLYTPSDSVNYESVYGEIFVRMVKADADVTVRPTYSFAYNGGVHIIPDIVASHTEATLKYKDSAGDAFDINSIKNVGTYEFTVYLEETEHYKSVEKTVVVTVTRGNYSGISSPEGLFATFGDSLSDVALPLNEDGVWSWENSPDTLVGGAGIRTFRAVFTPNDTGYSPVYTDVNITVSKAAYTPSDLGALSATYGDTLFDVTLPTDACGTWSWSSPITTSVGGVGTRIFTAVFTHNDALNYESYEHAFVVEVGKKSVDIPTIASKMYTGGLLKADIAYNALYTVTANVGGINAGNYEVLIKLNNPASYIWENGTEEAELSLTFTVTKAKISVSGLSIGTWSFGEAAKSPTYTVTDGYDGDITLIYTGITKSGIQYSSSVAPTEAGNYEITVSIEPTDNCDILIASACATFAVDSKKVNIPSSTSKDYTGLPQTADVNTVGKPYSVKSNLGGTEVTDAGYDVILTLESLNYVWYDGTNTYEGLDYTVKFYITKAENGWKNAVSVPNIEYGSKEVEYRAEAVFGTDKLTVEYKPRGSFDTEYSTVKPTVVGLYTARFTIPDSKNYSGIIGESDFEITIADNKWLTAPSISKTGWEFGEAAALLTLGNAKFGTPSVTVNGKTFVSMPTDAGEYVINVYVPATANYRGIDKEFTVVIDKKAITIPSDVTKKYTGRQQTSEFAGEFTAENVSVTDAGEYGVTLTILNSKNYEWLGKESETSVTVKFIITQAENGWITAPTLDKNEWKYDESAAIISSTQSSFGSVKVYLNGEEIEDGIIPEGLDVGSYTLTLIVDETDNYEGLSKTLTFEITKAYVVIPEIAASSAYNGNEQSAVLGTLFAMRRGQLYTVKTNVSVTDRGLYDIVLELVDPDNYMWVKCNSDGEITETLEEAVAPSKFEITKAQNAWLEGYAPSVESIFFGSDVTASAKSLFGTSEIVVMYKPLGADDSEYTATVPSAVGSYVARFTVASDANENYSPLLSTTEFTISKKQIPIPDDVSVVFNNKNQTSAFSGEFNASNVTVKSVGSYDVILTLYSTDSYEWIDSDGVAQPGASVTVKYSITKATVSVSGVAIDSWRFDGDEGALSYIVSGAYDGVVDILYTGTANSGIAYSSKNAPTLAGSYRVTVTITPTDNCDVNVASGYDDFTIGRKIVTKPTATPVEMYYDSENHIPTISGLDADCIKGENPGITDVGDYYVSFTLPDAYNYEWNVGGYGEVKVKYYTVKQAENVWVTEPSLDKYEWKYDEAPAILAGSSSFGSVKLALNGEIIEEIPVKLDVGSYTLTVWVEGNSNYTALPKETFDFEIKPAEVDVSLVPTVPFVKKYNTAWQYAGASAGVGYKVTDLGGEIVGTYSVIYSLDGDNYIWSDGTYEPKTVDFVIDPMVIPTPNVEPKTYTGGKIFPDYVIDSLLCEVILDNGGTDVGSYPVHFKLFDSHNYAWSSGDADGDGIAEVDFVITKAMINGWASGKEPKFDKLEWTYGEDGGVASAEANFGDVIIEYKPRGASDSLYDDKMPTDAGWYTARFYVEPTDDYAALTPVTIDFHIKKKVITITVTDKDFVFDNEEKSVEYTVSGLLGEDTVTVLGNTAHTAAGSYDITLTVNETNYECEPVPVTLYIAQAEYIPTVPGGITATYGDTLTDVDIPSAEDGEWSWTDVNGVVDAVGLLSFEAVFTPTDTNYAPYTAELSVNAGRKTLTISVTQNVFEYESGVIRSVLYSVSGFVCGDTDVTVNGNISEINADTYDVILTVDSVNYTARLETQLIINPTEYPDKTVPTGLEAKYGDILSDVELPEDENGVWTWVSPNTLIDSVGSRPFSVKFTPNSKNYKPYTVSATVLVEQRTVTIRIDRNKYTYDSFEKTVAYTVLGLVGEDTVTVLGNLSETENGTYSVILTINETNYRCEPTPTSLIIEKANYTPIIPTNLSATFLDSLGTVDIADVDENGTWSWDDGNSTLVGEAGINGFAATFKHSNENYNDYKTTLNINVGKKSIPVPADDISVEFINGEQKTTYEGNEIYSVTNAAATGIGNYFVYFKLLDTKNYEWESEETDTASVKFDITKATVSVSGVTMNDWRFDGTASKLVFDVGVYDGEVVIRYTGVMNNGEEYDSDAPPTFAGDYRVTVTITPTDNCDVNVASGYDDFTIGRKIVTKPTATPVEMYYDSENHIPTISGLDADCIKGENPGITDVGDYYVSFTLPDAYNYEWNVGGYGEVKVKYYTVKQAENGWVTEPSLNKDKWQYNQAVATLNNCKASFGTVKLYFNGEEVDAIPEGLDHGNYTLIVKVEGNDNYLGLESELDFIIERAIVRTNVLPTKISSKTYNKLLQTADVGLAGEGYTITNNGGIDAGSYDVIYSLVSDNYVWEDTTSEPKKFNFVIDPKPISVPGDVDKPFTKEYNTEHQTSGVTAGEGYTIEELGGTDAGSYPMTFKLQKNYVWVGGSYGDVTLNCFKITPKKIKAPDVITTVKYNGDAQYAVSDSELYYVYGYTSPDRTDVGSYTVSLAFIDTHNYEWLNGKSTSLLVIESQTPTLSKPTVSGGGWIWGSFTEAKMPSATVSNIKGITPKFYIGDDEVTADMLGALVPGKYTVVAKVEKSDNYDEASTESTFVVDKISVTPPSVTGTYYYLGVGKTITASVAKNDELYEITTNSGYENAGWHNVVLTLENPDCYKWSTDETGESATVKIPFEVKKAQATVTSLSITPWSYGSYNATANKLVVSGSFFDSEVSIRYVGTTNGGEEYDSDEPPTEAGSYTVIATVAGTDNCLEAEEKTYPFTVSRKQITVPTGTYNATYNGSKQYPAIGADSSLLNVGGETDAGTHTVSITIKDTDNYEWKDGTVSVKSVTFYIEKATPTVIFNNYNGAVMYQNNVEITGYAFINGVRIDGSFVITDISNESNKNSDKALRYNPSSYRTNQVVSYKVRFVPNSNNYNTVNCTEELYVVLKPAAYIGNSTTNARWYGSIEDALKAAEAMGTVTVWAVMDNTDMYSGGNTIVNDCVIPQNVTLVIPYAEGARNLDDNATINGVHRLVKGDYGEGIYKMLDTNDDDIVDTPSKTTYLRVTNTVTVAPGVKIINNGRLEIAGELSGGNGNSQYSSFTAGAAAQLVLSRNAEITNATSNAVIKCYGFIEESYKNNGSKVTVSYGEIHMPFVVRDHRGGTRIAGVVMGGGGIASVFNRFTFNNVMSTLQIDYNGTLIAIANLYADGENHNSTSTIVGRSNQAIIQFSKTSSMIIAKYDKDTEVCDLDIYGGATTNGMSISAAGNEVNTEDYAFPIPYHFNISLKVAPNEKTAEYTMDQLFKMLPGSKIVVEEGVTLNVSEINILGKDFVDPCDILPYPNNGTNSINQKTKEVLEGGMLIVYGHLELKSGGKIGGNVYIASAGTSSDLSGQSCTTKELKTASIGGVINSFNEYKQSVNVIVDKIEIALDANGGTVDFDKSAGINGKYSELPVPTRAGYVFLGWFYEGNKVEAGNVLAVSQDHVLTASWQACNVIFFGTDDVEFKTPITVTDGKYPTLPVITRTGLNFVGWSYNGTQVKAGDKIESSEYEIRLIPIWESKLAVFFDSGYELFIPTVYVEGTQVYPTLPTLERPGYEFGGWYYGTTPISSGSALLSSKSHCIRAKWTEIKGNTVKLEANGGTCSTDTLFALEGESVTLPTPTRVGHSFSGWYTAATGGTKIGGAGASYTPTSNITLYAQWTPYKVTFNANGGSCSTSSSNAGEDGKVTLPTPTRSGYDFNGWFTATSGGTKIGGAGETYTPTSDITLYAQWSSCVTGDTLITLADGTQVRVDSLRGDELLLVWNMQTGSFDFAPIMFVDSDPEAMLEIINLHFSDGTVVRVIYEHGFWDYDLNRYVYLDANSEAYIGHYFAKQNGDTLERVQLTDVTVTTELTTAWSPVTVGHLCYFVNGMLSMPGGVGGLFNIFEVNPETMAYDEEAMLRDIEAYGLFTYEELNAIAPLSEEMFEAAGGAYMKISIAKGNLTMEELISMIERYSRFFS